MEGGRRMDREEERKRRMRRKRTAGFVLARDTNAKHGGMRVWGFLGAVLGPLEASFGLPFFPSKTSLSQLRSPLQ